MKANKALKRLTKIEASLSVLIERYPANERSVQAFLHDAKRAVSIEASRKPEANATAKAGETKRRHPIAKGRKRISLAAKKGTAVQTTKKTSAKARKKPPTPIVKGAARTKAAGRAVAKKAPVRQVAKKAAPVASSRSVKKKIPAKMVKKAVAERTNAIVEGSEQVVPLPEAPAQDRTPAEENIGLTRVKSRL